MRHGNYMDVFLLWTLFISYTAASVAFFIWSFWIGAAWSLVTTIGFFVWAGRYFKSGR